ncbi:MAG: LacI family DNA-binding transcriptional regulator [Janthinobacterium lividum]
MAAAAGVAPMTVSRYLNQHPNVTDKTARKVAGAIKQLGYTPNVAARILMGQPSNTIGLIVPTLADAFFSEIAHHVQAVARERGKLVWVASTDSDSSIEASVLEQMKQHHVDGILLVPVAGRHKAPGSSGRIPIVALDRPLEDEDESDAILVDNRGGAARMVEHLIGHGYKRILCLSADPPSTYTIGERIAGYQDAMRKHRLKIAVRSSLSTREELGVQVRAAMKSATPPQAMFATNNITTIHLLETLFEDGRILPRDIAVGGFDDFGLASYMRPGVTVVRQPAAELGQQAARLLLDRLVAKDTRVSGLTTVLPTTLVIRGSCGCTPGKEAADPVR